MRVSDLNVDQRQALNEMAFELMTMGVMWGIDNNNRASLLKRAQLGDAGTLSVADIIRELMGDFPNTTPDIKPSAFDKFLVTLE